MKTPPKALVTVVVSMRRRPAVRLAVPWLVQARPLTNLSAALDRVLVPLVVKLPAPLMVPPLQLKVPGTVKLSAPVRMPPESAKVLAILSVAPSVSTSSVPALCTMVPVAAMPRLPRTLSVPPFIASWPAPAMFEPAPSVRVPTFSSRVRPASMSYRPLSAPPTPRVSLPGPFTFTVPVLLNAVIEVPIWPSVVAFQFSVPALVKVPTPAPE